MPIMQFNNVVPASVMLPPNPDALNGASAVGATYFLVLPGPTPADATPPFTVTVNGTFPSLSVFVRTLQNSTAAGATPPLNKANVFPFGASGTTTLIIPAKTIIIAVSVCYTNNGTQTFGSVSANPSTPSGPTLALTFSSPTGSGDSGNIIVTVDASLGLWEHPHS
jgi:hypothetical protein